MAKKDNTVKSFILRVDADMMEAIEAWAADDFAATMAKSSTFWNQPYQKAGRLKKKRHAPPQNDDKSEKT